MHDVAVPGPNATQVYGVPVAGKALRMEVWMRRGLEDRAEDTVGVLKALRVIVRRT